MTDNQSRCYERAQECYRIAAEKMGILVRPIPIQYSNRMTKTAGKFTFRGEESLYIRLSNTILEDNVELFIERTVGHEVAHHIVHEKYGRNVQPHGKEWKEVMAVLGQEASRCHNYKTVQNKVKYIVEGKEYFLGKIQHGRCQRGQVYINGKTKARITASAWAGL